MWYLPVSIGFSSQLIFGIILTFIFLDASPGLLELMIYPSLALVTFIISIAIFLSTKNYKKSFLWGVFLYLLLVTLLSFLYIQENTVSHSTISDGMPPQIALFVTSIHIIILFLTLFFAHKNNSHLDLLSHTQKSTDSKYEPKIQKILQEANLPKSLSKDLRKELESYFYEKEQDLRFSGMKSDQIEKQIQKDFGDENVVGSTLKLVHALSFSSFLEFYMKKIIITFSIFFVGLLFWAPWMSDDGGEDVVLHLRHNDLSVQATISQLAEKYNLSTGYDCDGIWTTWAPFGRMVRLCGGGWYVTFWGQHFYMQTEDHLIRKSSEKPAV